MNFKNKKVLLVGLGALGGGESTATYLIKKGAILTITDLKDEVALKKSVAKLKNKARLVLGRHEENDFKNADIVVFNQSVPKASPWVKLAKRLGKPVETAFTIFGHEMEMSPTPYIGITGTRGKTTTSHFISSMIPGSVLGGNIPGKNELDVVEKKAKVFVLELSSFQLEFNHAKIKQPKIAIITNIYNDHLNRYGTFENYSLTKAMIFRHQSKSDFLILNKDNKETKKLLALKPKSKVYYSSLFPLKKNENGIFIDNGKIIFQENNKSEILAGVPENFARHQRENLLVAMLGSFLYLRDWGVIIKKIKNLPEVPFRQQTILKKKNLCIINDSASTSPDAVIAAIEKFKNKKSNLILITGGTDKALDFKKLAEEIKRNIEKKNLYLLEGSATVKLIHELDKKLFSPKAENIFEELKKIIESIELRKNQNNIILFSPGASSFEKFKNEFDRGQKFNKFAKEIFSK